MPLSVGDKFGPYEILALLGAGGMGEVYRARDYTLKRDVALKVLPAAFLDDPERAARFQREAEVLASLDHPNIAPIHGLIESEGARALVLALIEGQTLADRITAGRLPVDEVVNISRQIIEALEYAHERGVVHRDLKPANVKLTADGLVKVLDFGLAKVLEEDPSVTASANSPTLTLGHTRAGVILGTAAYMSPEQAVGRPVDRRSDIFSFGVVLYEMLTRTRAFEGATVPDLLEGVVQKDPDWSRLPAETPGAVAKVLRRCLVKDRKQRMQAIGEARIALNESTPEQVATTPPSRPWLVMALAATTIVLAVVAIAGWLQPRLPGSEPSGMTLTVVPLPGIALDPAGFGSSAPEISPDGSAVMYHAGGRLYVRRLNSLEPRAVLGSELASNAAFWSADSTAIVFPTGQGLMRTHVPDGAPQLIAAFRTYSRGGSWSDAGTILISAGNGQFGPGGDALVLWSGQAAGGELKPVEVPGLQNGSFFSPEFLPGSEDFLFVFVPVNNADDAAVYLATLRGGKGVDPVVLLKNQTAAHYTPSGGGRMLFVRNDDLYSQKLNRGTRKLEGESELVVPGVASQPYLSVHRGDFSVARNGTIAWRPGRAALSQATMFDRTGNATATTGPPGPFVNLVLSPDERHLLVTSDGDSLMEVGQPGRLALPSDTQWFGWSADGSKLLGVRGAAFVEMSSSGSGEIRELRQFGRGGFQMAGLPDISPDGQYALGANSGAILSARLRGAPETVPEVVVQGNSRGARYSPDGRWFVYIGGDSGTGTRIPSVFVHPFPGPGQRRQIAAVGTDPVWRKDGKEIVFSDREGRAMSVTVEAAGSDLRFGAPRVLFTGLQRPPGAIAASTPLAVSRDGSRIFWVQGIAQPESNVIHVTTGWAK